MTTDPCTGMRSIRPAGETYATVAVLFMLLATVLRVVNGRPGAFAGTGLMLLAFAVLSRYRISWDREGILYQTPFSFRRRSWSEFSEYRVEPDPRGKGEMTMQSAGPGVLGRSAGWRLRLLGRTTKLTIGLAIYPVQDVRHLIDRVNTEVPLAETEGALVS